MHSGGLELAKMTYTRLDDNLIRHRGDRTPDTRYNIKIKIHSSCEIEYFVETHLCKLCVILRSRVSRVVSSLMIYYSFRAQTA